MYLTKLPLEMAAGIPENTDKWMKIGLSTCSQLFPDKAMIKRHMSDAYRVVDLEPPQNFLWLDSPFQGFVASIIISRRYRSVKSQLSSADSPALLNRWYYRSDKSGLSCPDKPLLLEIALIERNIIMSDTSRLIEDLLSSLKFYIDEGIKEPIRRQILTELEGQDGEFLFRQFLIQFEEQTNIHIGGSLIDKVWQEFAGHENLRLYRLNKILELAGFGQHHSFLAYYDYFSKYVPACERARPLMNLAAEVGWFWAFDNACVITPKPVLLHRNERGRLHCKDDMAIKYPDGWGIYVLNGIIMKREHVLTPVNQMKTEMVLKESNIARRRELLKKIGIENLVSHGEVIEESEGYKLIDMRNLFPEIGYAPYLLMKNPSLPDTHHLEGVSPVCRTIQQAINWRAGNVKVDWMPDMLS